MGFVFRCDDNDINHIFGLDIMKDTTEFKQHRGGCDCCKFKRETQRFDGYCGDVLYICKDCFKELKKGKMKEYHPPGYKGIPEPI